MSFREKIENGLGFLEEKLAKKSEQVEDKFAFKHADSIGKMQDRKDMAGESMRNFMDRLRAWWQRKTAEFRRKRDRAEAKRLRRK